MRILEFRRTYLKDKPLDEVLIAPSGAGGEKAQTWHRVEKLRPRDYPVGSAEASGLAHRAMAARWELIGPAYEAWLKGTELPVDGLPLAAWSGVTPEQAEFLKRFGIVTVEQVRDMTEATYTKLPWPDARQMPRLAKDFLESRGAAELVEKNKAMEDKIAALEEMLQARIATEEAAKPKRGRPPKAQTSEEAAA